VKDFVPVFVKEAGAYVIRAGWNPLPF